VLRPLHCHAEIDVKSITPAVNNDPSITTKVQQAANQMLKDAVIDSHYMTMSSEDMAYMLQRIPGCYFFIGSANQASGLDAPHHSSKFNIDETIMPNAVGLMTGSIMKLLDN
jgi:amidohydrolase